MSGDIIVIGNRPGSNSVPDSNFAMDLHLLFEKLSNETIPVSVLPAWLRNILNIETSVEIDSVFDKHHQDLIKLAVAKLTEIPDFKAAMEY